MTRITASVSLRDIPRWALLERELLRLLDRGWRRFEERFCQPDGSLRYDGRMYGRDGVDDFYEPFFNWPALYRLGGADDLLPAAKRHWEGVTRQMTAFGFVHDEYEVGYDWFHQGESLPLFLGICAADPADMAFRERARRFAGFYLADSPTGNYDPTSRTIVAPHTGSLGPRWGVGEDWTEYSADQPGMEIYGLPLRDIDGIETWDDLRAPGAAARMGAAMQERMGRGDTVVNLAATTLATNAWLYDHEDRYRDWALEYIDAWRERAAANEGVLPDNVGPGGRVGELHGGAWYGGHYGWTWPHGLHTIAAAATVAALNSVVLTGGIERLDLASGLLDAVLEHAQTLDRISTRGSLGPGWAERLGADEDTVELLVPYRFGPDGWFDLHPVPIEPAMWLDWVDHSPDARDLLGRIRTASSTDWREVRWFHDKEEQGHEAPWLEFLDGRNDDYPERALDMAIGQVLRRLSLMDEADDIPADGDIHFWQRLNPVVTEVLAQLVTGAPPAVYYGGLSFARVLIADALRGRPGLPEDVAALVRRADENAVSVELVNLGDAHREVVITAGSFSEDRIRSAVFDRGTGYPGSPRDYTIPAPAVTYDAVDVAAPKVTVALPPRTRIALELAIERRAYPATHQLISSTQENP
ncbi:hypothetical protein ACI3KT_05925 [Microbacterium sp. ZW T6_19]|uniref:hypothetical protein n=1 Tax=Microbacterium sp. ZW T6_19 TaxID=3378082 RepID=UPI003852AF2F